MMYKVWEHEQRPVPGYMCSRVRMSSVWHYYDLDDALGKAKDLLEQGQFVEIEPCESHEGKSDVQDTRGR